MVQICHCSRLPIIRSAKDILICAELSHVLKFCRLLGHPYNAYQQTKKTESLRLLTKRSSAFSENIPDSLEITKSPLSSRLVVWEILLMPGELSLRTSPNKWGRSHQRSRQSRKSDWQATWPCWCVFIVKSMSNFDFWSTSVFGKIFFWHYSIKVIGNFLICFLLLNWFFSIKYFRSFSNRKMSIINRKNSIKFQNIWQNSICYKALCCQKVKVQNWSSWLSWLWLSL